MVENKEQEKSKPAIKLSFTREQLKGLLTTHKKKKKPLVLRFDLKDFFIDFTITK